MKTNNRKSIVILVLILAISLSCNLPGSEGNGQPDLEATITAQALLLSTPANQTAPDRPALTATPRPRVSESTPTAFVALVPMVTVSVATNCRTGPGTGYDQIGSLPVGVSAEVVGKNTATNYWIIKNPDSSGTCWLWGRYATISGNVDALLEYAANSSQPTLSTLGPGPSNTPKPPPPSVPGNTPHTPKPPQPPVPSNTPDPLIIIPGEPPPPFNPKPSAPSNLWSEAVCSPLVGGYHFEVTIHWDDVATFEDGYNIYVDGALTNTVGANSVQSALSFDGYNPATIGVEAFTATNKSAMSTAVINCP